MHSVKVGNCEWIIAGCGARISLGDSVEGALVPEAPGTIGAKLVSGHACAPQSSLLGARVSSQADHMLCAALVPSSRVGTGRSC